MSFRMFSCFCQLMERKEFRGLHYTLDYPEMSTEVRKTVLTPPNFKVEQPLVNT